MDHIHFDLEAPTPCEGCPFKRRCAARELACERFVMFASGDSRRRWELAPRAPTRAQFDALFAD